MNQLKLIFIAAALALAPIGYAELTYGDITISQGTDNDSSTIYISFDSLLLGESIDLSDYSVGELSISLSFGTEFDNLLSSGTTNDFALTLDPTLEDQSLTFDSADDGTFTFSDSAGALISEDSVTVTVSGDIYFEFDSTEAANNFISSMEDDLLLTLKTSGLSGTTSSQEITYSIPEAASISLILFAAVTTLFARRWFQK